MVVCAPDCGGLRLDDVKVLAEQEYCEVVFAAPTKPATFRKYDPSSNSYVRIDVYCSQRTANVTVEHPRQGKMRTFFRDMDKKSLREIFRAPRECAGYSDLKRNGQSGRSSGFAYGEVVQVHGYGLRGCAKVVGVRDHITGLIKIQFADGKEYRAEANQLTKAHFGPRPEPPRMGKCQTLKNEAKLQLKRLDRELERLQAERMAVLALQAELEEDARAAHAAPGIPQYGSGGSPTSVTRTELYSYPRGFEQQHHGHQHQEQQLHGQQHHREFGANLNSILSDSGAFAAPLLQPSFPPVPPFHLQGAGDHSVATATNDTGSAAARSILPPLNHPGYFNV